MDFSFFFPRRTNLLPNREKLKTFIRSYAIRLGNRADSPWIFYDNSIKEKYQIKDRISSIIIENFQKTMTITLDVIRIIHILLKNIRLYIIGDSSRTRTYLT